MVDDHNTTNLTNRFLPLDFPTVAVFSVDDDIVYSCRQLWAAYEVWRQHPDQMVGFAPRYIDKQEAYYNWTGSYEGTFGLQKANVLFVTKGGFLHRSIFSAYFRSDLDELRAEVNDATSGEDLLMSFLYAAQAPSRDLAKPVLVWNYDSTYVDCEGAHDINGTRNNTYSKTKKTFEKTIEDKKALGADPSSKQRRRQLVKHFFAHFGNPLVTATFEDFYHFTASTGRYTRHADILGPSLGGLNPLWWLRVNRKLWADRGNNCCI